MGNVLTDGNNITVEVVENGAFAGEKEWPKTDAEKLAYAAMFGGEVTLTEDITLAEPLKIVEGANVVLNLGGKTITTTLKQEGRHHYAIENDGSLTLEGEGAINARGVQNFGTLTVNGDVVITNIDTNGGAAIWNEGKVTINGGTFATSTEAGDGSYGSALNTRVGGEAIVNGGTFIANSQLTYAIINEGTTTINNATVKGKHGAVATTNGTTTIYNGTFEQVDNPDTSDHCIYASGSGVATVYGGKYKIEDIEQKNGGVVFCKNQGGTITIAEGYKTIEKNDWFYVVADSVDAVATNDDELQAALADKKSVVLTNDIASNGPLAIYGSVVDGNGNTINANSGSAAYESGVTVAEGTLQNVTVSGAFRALGVGGSGAYKMTGDAYYKNVTTVGATYGFNIGVGNGKKIYVSDSTIGDWNSYSGLSGAEFTNCTFISAGYYYASQRISANATFTYTNCKFEQNTYNNPDGSDNYYLNSYGNGTIVLKNCYVGNTLVTAENVNTLFQINGVTVKVE